MTADYYDEIMGGIAQARRRRDMDKNARRAARAGRVIKHRKKTAKLAGYDPRSKTQPPKPFTGADGEGALVEGRHQYLLFRAGDRLLFDNNRPLRTAELLDFICELPNDRIYCGFFFDYDTTKILADLPLAKQRLLFTEPRPATTRWVFWKRWAIDYFPRQYFKVAPVPQGGRDNWPPPGSARTIWEVGGCFQSAFVTACKTWGIGTDAEREAMKVTKDQRAGFSRMDEQLIAYNARECEWLAEMMEKLRVRSFA